MNINWQENIVDIVFISDNNHIVNTILPILKWYCALCNKAYAMVEVTQLIFET
jgi:hypothetical protein